MDSERDTDKVYKQDREMAFMTDPPAECGVDEDQVIQCQYYLSGASISSSTKCP